MIEQTLIDLTAAVNRLADTITSYNTFAEGMTPLLTNQLTQLTKLTDEPTPAPKKSRTKATTPDPVVINSVAEAAAEMPVEEPTEVPEPTVTEPEIPVEPVVEETPVPEPAGTPVTHEDVKDLVRNFRSSYPDKREANVTDMAKVCADLAIENVSKCPEDKLAALFFAVQAICSF